MVGPTGGIMGNFGLKSLCNYTYPLRFHLCRLPPLGFAELGGDDDQAQVDHEERTDLGTNKTKSLL